MTIVYENHKILLTADENPGAEARTFELVLEHGDYFNTIHGKQYGKGQ